MSGRYRKPDENKKFRNTLAFFLYLSVSIISVCACLLVYIANPSTVVKMFTSRDYVESLRADIVCFAEDMSLANSIPDDFIEDSISYQTIYHIEKSYASTLMGETESFSNEAFDNLLEELDETINSSITAMLKQQGVTVDNKTKASIRSFCDRIVQYTRSKIELKLEAELTAALFKAQRASIALIVLSSIASAVIIYLIYSKGGKRLRVVRTLSYSVFAAAMLNAVMIIAIAVVKQTKDLVIYPSYMVDAFMSYVNGSMQTFAFSTTVLLFIFLSIVVRVWTLKRKEEE